MRKLVFYLTNIDRITVYKLIVFACALSMLAIAIWWTVGSVSLLRSGIRTTAKCFKVVETKTRARDLTRVKTVYWLEFADQNGIRQEAKSQGGSFTLGEGKTAPIVYDSNDPTKIRVLSFWDLWGSSIVLVLLAVLTFFAGIKGFGSRDTNVR